MRDGLGGVMGPKEDKATNERKPGQDVRSEKTGLGLRELRTYLHI